MVLLNGGRQITSSLLVRTRNQRRRGTVDSGITPGHTVTIEPSDRHVEVWLDGEKLADSDRPSLLHETGLPTRYYLPKEDVRLERFRPTSFTTTCPFKGSASNWSLEVGDEIHDGLLWSYAEPIPGAEAIAGLVCFYTDRVELTIDGEPAAA